MKSAGISNIGLHRRRNEDSYSINEDHGIFIVCDGMGGHKGGDVASRLAVQTILDNLNFKPGEQVVTALHQASKSVELSVSKS